MPIYEFYCPDCNVIFNFFARSVTSSRKPKCPKCGGRKMRREISKFAMTGKAREPSADDAGADLPVDEERMGRAMEALAGEAEKISEDDPRQAAQLMRKFSKMTGLKFGNTVEEAINRMEAGEDPEAIEAELGDRINEDEPFVLPEGGEGKAAAARRRRAPTRDGKLYDL